MRKFCIFCGEKPENKSKEHVIPKWLINKTGDPNRDAFFGIDFTSDPPIERMFSFSSFTFPACGKCNSEFSELESQSKSVVTKLLNKNPISSNDIDLFLNWLDKVRIGLWLSYYYLDRKLVSIEPHFFIKSRYRKKDRMLIIYRCNDSGSKILFLGVDSLGYLLMPSCFTLILNDLCFFNASNNFLCERRLGFPFAKTSSYLNVDGLIDSSYVRGKGRKIKPVFRYPFLKDGTHFYQPIFSEWINNPDAKSLWDCDYVRANSKEWSKGIGKIFTQAHSNIHEYPEEPTLKWLPENSYDFDELIEKIYSQTLKFQYHLFTNTALLDKLSVADRRHMKKQQNSFRRLNKFLIERASAHFEFYKDGNIEELRKKIQAAKKK